MTGPPEPHPQKTNQKAPSPSPRRDCVVMSLRGSEATEAISQGIDISEIATLPAVARNDRKGIMTQSLDGGGRGWGWTVRLNPPPLSPLPQESVS
jgi:hypothetical protein